MRPSPNSALKTNDVPAPRGCSRGHVGSHPGSAPQPLWPQVRNQQETKPIPALGTTRGSTAGHKEHVPQPSSSQRMLCSEWTQSLGSWDKLSMETSQEPRVLIYHYNIFSPSFSCCLNAICSTCGGPMVSCHSCSAPSAPRAVGRGRFSLRGAFFCFHDHTNCNKLYKKTLASPKVWQQPFSVWAKGTRLSHPLLLHHTCPSASSPSAPVVFGPFSQAAFSAAFSTPVLLAASCQTANKTH